MKKCQMYGCRDKATSIIDIWAFCNKHADAPYWLNRKPFEPIPVI